MKQENSTSGSGMVDLDSANADQDSQDFNDSVCIFY
jgi:hypothetical protein